MNNLRIERNEDGDFFIKKKLSNGQTFYMAFQEEGINNKEDTIYFNIYMTLYTKRKSISRNEAEVLSTGRSPFETIVIATKSFYLLEKKVIDFWEEYYNIIIHAYWLDKKRFNVYNKFLTKNNYKLMNFDGSMNFIKKINLKKEELF